MSEQSQSIAELAKALNKAQAVIGNAVRTSENPFFKSHYADLASVREAYQPAFSENGLSLVQMPYSKDGRVGVETMLMHSSGEWVKQSADVMPAKNDPQSYGSAVTYLRRYAAAAFAGIATEDDDGEGAQGRKPEAVQKPQPATVTKPAATAHQPAATATNGGCSEAQIKRLYAIAKSKNVDTNTLPGIIADEYPHVTGDDGKIHLTRMSIDEYEAVCKWAESGGEIEGRPVEDNIPMGDPPAPAPITPPKGITEIWPEATFDQATEVIVAPIVNVIEPKIGKSGKPGPWKVEIQHDGQVVIVDTFDKNLAALAQGYGAGGEQHEIAYSTTKRGGYTNRVLLGIR